MSTFFGDSIYEHPVVKRLRQQVQELERQKEDLKKLNSQVEIEWMRTSDELSKTKESLDLERRSYDSVSEIARKYRAEIIKFNNLSPIQKMFYHFDISSWFIK